MRNSILLNFMLPKKMYIFSSIFILSNLLKIINAYTLLGMNLVNNYIEEYISNIYLEESLVKYMNESFFFKENDNIERSLLRIHKEEIIGQLGGNERLIELLKLLKNNEREQEELLEENIELRDYLDKNLLKSNLDLNKYYYINNVDINNEKSQALYTNTFEIKFNGISNNFNNYKEKINRRFEVTINYMKKERNLDNNNNNDILKQTEIYRYKNNKLLELSNGYYISKKKINKNERTKGLKYRLKIESPMEIMDFNELILLDEIKIFFDQLYEEEDEYIERDNIYQEFEISKLITNIYPVCEIKCVIKELENKVQWSRKINKLKLNNIYNQNYEIIKSYNWCNRLIFHNCIDFEIESLRIDMMNEGLINKVELFERSIDKEINYQIQKYFLNYMNKINLKLDSKLIGKLLILNELLEKDGYIITRNTNNNQNGKELLIKYEKISKYSKNIVSLKQILSDRRIKLNISNKFESGSLNSSLKSCNINKKYSIIPTTNQKIIFDVEQIVNFIQNVLFLFKQEKLYKRNKIILPWYNQSKNSILKQDKYIETLFFEYDKLLRLLINNKFINKEKFYRMNLLNTYSLISHFKSFEITNLNKEKIYLGDPHYSVATTTLSYLDQVKFNNIFRSNKTYILNVNKKLYIETNDIKLIQEYYAQLNDDFIISIYDQELYKRKINIEENYPINKAIEIPKLSKKISEINNNLDINFDDIIFRNNVNNFGFNIAFINYIYQNSINMDDVIINSPPWWMIWQSQFYPKLSLINNENEINIFDIPNKYLKEINSTWLEIPVNSEIPNISFDLGSFIPRDIISKEMLESVILEEVELVNPTYKNALVSNKDFVGEINQIIKEKQQNQINSWKKSDIINDPNNLLFYNLNSRNINNRIGFNLCIFNVFGENSNSEWFSNCVKKWKMYSTLFDHFHSTINHYLHLSTFFDLIKEIKTILMIKKTMNN